MITMHVILMSRFYSLLGSTHNSFSTFGCGNETATQIKTELKTVCNKNS